MPLAALRPALFSLVLALAPAAPLAAQDLPLGLNFVEAELSYGHLDGGPGGRLGADFAITGAHGLQLDLSLSSFPGGTWGQLDAHLYMAPQGTVKYGLFASLADADGREATWGMAGAEVMVAVTPRVTVEAQAGIGMARSRAGATRLDLDFIAASGRITHRTTDALSLFAEVQAAEFDEMALRATALGLHVGLRYSIPGQPVELVARIGRDRLTGRDARPGETVASLAAVWRFGAAAPTLRNRGWSRPAPFDPLLRRGMF